MMSFSAWFTFFLLMAAIAYTPGPMTMFSMSSSVRNGFYRTLPAIAGGSFAYLIQMAVVYWGLGVVVKQSMLVFNAIKWAGVLYQFLLAVSFFFIQGSSAIVYALFGARVFLWMRQRCPTHVQSKVTAVILVLAGGMLACSEK